MVKLFKKAGATPPARKRIRGHKQQWAIANFVPAMAPENNVAGIIKREGSVETSSKLLKATSGKASAILWIAGVIVPMPMATKNTDITANVTILLLCHNQTSQIFYFCSFWVSAVILMVSSLPPPI